MDCPYTIGQGDLICGSKCCHSEGALCPAYPDDYNGCGDASRGKTSFSPSLESLLFACVLLYLTMWQTSKTQCKLFLLLFSILGCMQPNWSVKSLISLVVQGQMSSLLLLAITTTYAMQLRGSANMLVMTTFSYEPITRATHRQRHLPQGYAVKSLQLLVGFFSSEFFSWSNMSPIAACDSDFCNSSCL